MTSKMRENAAEWCNSTEEDAELGEHISEESPGMLYGDVTDGLPGNPLSVTSHCLAAVNNLLCLRELLCALREAARKAAVSLTVRDVLVE